MAISTEELYKTRSAVLFIIFNRPDTTKRVFEEIRKAKPAKLYIAADGARPDKSGEQNLCAEARSIAESIDWDCQVFKFYHDTNLGCRNAVSDAITWFFDNEEEGIILEDDCLPANSFFSYCDEMLENYRHDTRIGHICGCNLQLGQQRGEASYYFSKLSNVWGWASWRRVWKNYDKTLARFSEADADYYFNSIFSEKTHAESWLSIFKQLKANAIDTWDYQLAILNLFSNSLQAVPNVNLISNIGFNAQGTHTLVSTELAEIPLQEMKLINHPTFVVPDAYADKYALDFAFKPEPRKRKGLKRLFKRNS